LTIAAEKRTMVNNCRKGERREAGTKISD